jgi:muconate cycloisomerase
LKGLSGAERICIKEAFFISTDIAIEINYHNHNYAGKGIMKITDIETFLIGLPIRRPHEQWYGKVTGKPHMIIKVKTDSEIEGIGECLAMSITGGRKAWGEHYGRSIGIITNVIHDFLEPAIKGMDPLNIGEVVRRMDEVVNGHPYAKSAIDSALYDIAGRYLQVPAYILLGGCIREKIPLAHSIGLMSPEKAASEASEAVQEGVKTIKLKVSAPGRHPEMDIEQVRAVREAVGDKIDITIDVNQGWGTDVGMAIKTIKKMEKYDLLFVEQPVQGLRAMAKIAAKVDTPLMADELAWTPQDVLDIVEHKAAEIITLYVAKPGGLYKCKKMAAVAEAAGLASNVNGGIEFGVGNAANLHLASSTESVTHANVIPVTNIKGKEQTKSANLYYLDDIIRNPFQYEDGCLIVPKKPGLGVEIDEEKMAKYRVPMDEAYK